MPNQEKESCATQFVNDWLKKILTFLVICSCIATITGCVFVISDVFGKEEETGPSGKQHDEAKYSNAEKAAAVVNYIFWLLLSLILFLVEWEPLWVFNYALFLHYWPGRGFMQLYLGIQIVHEAADMGSSEVLGLKGDSLKNVVKAMGFCFVGTGTLYILLSCCCLRSKDSNEVVRKVRRGGQEDSARTGKSPLANLALLKKMNDEDGVQHLGEAILLLEGQVSTEKKNRGIGGWWRRKFGDGDSDQKPGARQSISNTGAAPSVVSSGRGAELDSIAKGTPAVQTEYGTHANQAQRELPGNDLGPDQQPQVASSSVEHRVDMNDDEDDIKRRRREADERLEREYFARKYPE